MVLLERTMQATGWSLGAANTGYLSGFRDGGMVAPYAQEAMSHMIEYGIITGTPEQKLNPIQSISRRKWRLCSRVQSLSKRIQRPPGP